VIRDPLVIYIYFVAAQAGMFRLGAVELWAIALTAISFLATFVSGHADLIVALYGARTMVLHLPLIYVMGRALDIRYVNNLAKLVLILLLPMTALVVDQFYSPQSALVNVGVGGIGSAGFAGALDRFRPPGTFSFISGPVYFYALATACFFYQFLIGRTPTWFLSVAGICILVACPVSISRTFIAGVLITTSVGLVVLGLSRRLSSNILLRAGLVIFIASLALTQLPVVSDAVEAFEARWYASTTQEGGVSAAILDRFIDGLTGPFITAIQQPTFGFGLGMGTNVGAKLLVGRVGFLGGEAEWFRVISEMGPIIGVLFIGVRIAIFVGLLRFARQCWSNGNPVPSLFLSVAALPLLQAQWGQPTSLGFTMFASGLVLAAGRVPRGDVHEVRVPMRTSA
jgi:hypothetical protein